MRKKAFTMMEVIVILIILAILATLGYPAYKNTIEESKAKVCKANLEALSTALDIYAMEHDVMPGDLSELPSEYIQKAYARILQEKGAWKIKLAYFIVGWEQRGLAYAGLLRDIAHGNTALISCPSDPTPASQGGISYGINNVLVNMTSQAYRNLTADTLLIGDCEAVGFNDSSGLAKRHHSNISGMANYGQVINKGRTVNRIGEYTMQP